MKSLLKKSKTMIFFILAIITLLFILLPVGETTTNLSEALIYFPEDDKLTFIESNSNVKLLELKDENEYILEWSFDSLTDEQVYLRQDISLLFENGVLVDLMNHSEMNADKVIGDKQYYGEDSGKHEMITLHYAEVHHSDEVIKSKRIITSDLLYIIDSPLSPIMTFKKPSTTMESRSKDLLDSIIDQQLSYIYDGLIKEFNIDKSQYEEIPFTEIVKYNDDVLPSFSKEETSEIVGRLWEGLYRNYVLGINTFNDKEYDPIGNSLPLVLLHKGGGHLMVLFETADGTKQQLYQLIESH
ncbi:hypothetical protein [Evansella cellulosilytica]|uniref:Uncharacterized protein n=1 Tax=Evansella cellulosilytica (strain ATCC 21833 / DSM 2522 / FERM P-1141 / JCM 9156 / N-4) TaxID=649639 RepID=E6TWX3_EVAC2|nr:hypothetical protein [Evansella cellulosilytica]ADU29923.1 hypothetical protein Bcell_1660 [Evansella cellulosilytica DSM 2522]